MTLKLALLAVPLALVTSARAYRKGSLSRSGALAAVLVGSVSLTASIRLGCVLLVFFASSSKLTRVGSARKAELEGRNYAGPGGNRSAVQVLANSGAATLLAVAHLVLRGAHHRAAGARAWWAEPTEARLSFSGPLRALSLVQLAYVCHYACTTADTWASELGVLSRAPPRLITTGALVRPGTNGARARGGVRGGDGRDEALMRQRRARHATLRRVRDTLIGCPPVAPRGARQAAFRRSAWARRFAAGC